MPQKTKKRGQNKVANSVRDSGNLHTGPASGEDKVSNPVSDIAIVAVDHTATKPKTSDEEPEDDPDALFASDGEGSDVFDDDDYEYDSDGNMIFDAETNAGSTNKNSACDPASFEITPAHVERFIASLPIIQFGDLDQKDQKCGVCRTKYQVLGQTNELAVQLSCLHVVGKKCLGCVLGEKGRRNCPVCDKLLPIWSA